MNSELWANDRISVVILPKTDLADNLLDLAESWMKSWLITPALWIRPGDVKDNQVGPPNVVATVIGRNGRRELDLFEVLSRRHFEAIRLIAVQDPAGIGQEHDVTLEAMSSLRRYIGIALPDGDPNRNVKTQLLTFNMVFAASGKTAGDMSDLISRDWDANLLVSSEDRPTPNSVDTFTRLEESNRMQGFVLSNLATAAGLWLGNPDCLYDLVPPVAGVASGEAVILMRTFVRGVLSDGISLRVAARALEGVTQSASPLHDIVLAQQIDGLQLLPNQDVDKAIDFAVLASLSVQDGLLSYRAPAEITASGKRKVSLLQAIKEFLRFTWSQIRALPGAIIHWIKQKINRKATKAIYGLDGDTEVDIDLDLGKSSIEKADDQILAHLHELKKQIITSLDNPMDKAIRESNPFLWADIRSIIFRLLDGSSPPDSVKEYLPIVPNKATSIVPDSHDVLPDPDLGWTDVLEAVDVDADVLDALEASLREDLDIDLSSQRSWLDVSAATQVLNLLAKNLAEVNADWSLALSQQNRIDDELKKVKDRREAIVSILKGEGQMLALETFDSLLSKSDAILTQSITDRQAHMTRNASDTATSADDLELAAAAPKKLNILKRILRRK